MLIGATAFFGAWISRLDINADTDAFLEEDSPGVSAYYETREEWGTDEFAVFCVTFDDWFSEGGVRRLKEIDADLKRVPHVGATMSILDVPLLRQNPDKKPNLLTFAAGLKTLRDRKVDLAAAAKELGSHELTVGNLISADGKSLNILAYLDWSKNTDGQLVPPIDVRRTGLVEGVRKVRDKWNRILPEPVRLSGIPIIQITLYENMRHDLIVFGVASLLIFSLAFFVVYRRVRFVVLPIICCLLPPVGLLGAMAFFGVSIGFVTSNMPVLLFVLMLPYNVYFIERYRERRADHPGEDGLASTIAALKAIASPCLFSCATTLAGFGALATSRIIPVGDFGKIMTIGMGIGFPVVFLFIAAASRHLPGLAVRNHRPRSQHSRGLVRGLESLALARPGLVAALSALILAASIAGALRMSAETKFTSYFWPGSEAYQGLEFIDRQMGGTTWVEIILTSPEKGYFRTKAGLQTIDTVQGYFETVPETGNILSLTKLRDEMRKTFRPEWFPELSDSALLRLTRLAAGDLVGQTASVDFSTSRTTIRMMETSPGLNRGRILDGLRQYLKDHDEAFENLEIEITGVFPVYTEMINQLLVGQKESIAIVALAVYLMLLILFRSPSFSLLVLISQVVPATVILGIIGWAGIPLDLVTMMIASIALGVGIDASIQYAIRFRAELADCGDHRTALRRAHATIGRAIWIATSIIIAGFAILVLSDFFPSVWFGLFTALAMLISQLATLTLLPSLFLLVKPRP